MGDRKLLFDVSRPFVVRSAMVYRGASFAPGDVFDGAGISESDLVLLYQGGRIRNADATPPADVPPAPPPAKAKPKRASAEA